MRGMRLTVIDPNPSEHWTEVHPSGCAHLSRLRRGHRQTPAAARPLHAAGHSTANAFEIAATTSAGAGWEPMAHRPHEPAILTVMTEYMR